MVRLQQFKMESDNYEQPLLLACRALMFDYYSRPTAGGLERPLISYTVDEPYQIKFFQDDGDGRIPLPYFLNTADALHDFVKQWLKQAPINPKSAYTGDGSSNKGWRASTGTFSWDWDCSAVFESIDICYPK